MSCWRRLQAVATLIVAATLIGTSGSSCGGGGSEKQQGAATLDPMYAVSDRSAFSSTGREEGGWYWLRSQDQRARWDFRQLPANLTDLTTQLRVLVPPKVDNAHFYISYGTAGKSGDETLARAEAKLPVTSTEQGTGRGLASYDMVIPAASLPSGIKSLWIQAALEDDSHSRPPIDAEVGFQKASVRFTPLSAPAKPAAAESGGSTTTSTTSASPRVPPPPTTGTQTQTQPKPTTRPEELPPFFTDGDYINGWYWLRDASHEQSASWTLTAPTKSTQISLDLEVLATSEINGPRGVDARFYVSSGPVPETRPAASIPTQLVTLPNVSPADDPVGYTTRGTITVTKGRAAKFWVKITRVDASGSNPVSEHIAVNESSVKLAGGSTGTTTTGTTTTTAGGETTTSTGGETTTTSGGTTGEGEQQVLSCDGGTLAADSFAPVETAARWWVDSLGEHWFLMRTMGEEMLGGLPEGYVPINQSATWRFSALPAGSGDVRVRFTMPISGFQALGQQESMAKFSFGVTYGAIPAPAGADRIHGLEVLDVHRTAATARLLPTATPINQSLSAASWQPYPIYTGEVTLPRAALTGAAGYWVRLSAADPWTHDVVQAQPALNQQSAQVCTGGQPTTPSTGSATTPSPTVSWDKNTKILSSSSSVFTDPATDPDGDGINQNFENTAAELVNPVLEFDEGEEWLTHRSEHPTAMLVDVTPWPSYANPKYIVFEFLPTYAYDAGFGFTWNDLQLTGSGLEPMWTRIGYNEHRGDSEKIYEAYRVVDDTHLRLDWVATSAHDDGTEHNAVWSPNRSRCNVGHVVEVDNQTYRENEETEVWCSGLEFGGPQGQLLVYPGRDKHAVYPTKAACEQVTLVKIEFTSYVTAALSFFSFELLPQTVTIPIHETCGYDPLVSTGSFDGDPRYLGDGHWQFTVFNVGEPGNWLINSLSNPSGWRGLTSAKVAELTGKYPSENVWTGHNGLSSSFCGGLPIQVGNHTYPSGCSSRIGAKFDSLPGDLLALVTCNDVGAECPHQGHSGSG